MGHIIIMAEEFFFFFLKQVGISDYRYAGRRRGLNEEILLDFAQVQCSFNY
jgi:hypothetical protein